MTSLPPVAALASSPEHISPILSTLFEHAPAIPSILAPHLPRQFSSYNEFIDFASSILLTAVVEDDKKAEGVIAAHPRLGEPKTNLSEHSKKEQAAMEAADKRSAEEKEEEKRKLAELNRKYEEKFPGLRYVVFVNGRPRSVIMEDMERRIARGDREAEKKEAVEAMRDIAKDRARKLVKDE